MNLLSRVRGDSQPLNEQVAQDIVLAKANQSVVEFNQLLDSVLQGKAPPRILAQLDVAQRACDYTAVVSDWRQANLENLALLTQNADIVAKRRGGLPVSDLWDFANDIEWIQQALLSELQDP